MYFIALVAPGEINEQILKWKLWMKENYHCEVALRSPAHITLIPPYWMKPELENELMNAVDEFASKQNNFKMILDGFSFFKPRVIFVNVEKNEMLDLLQNDLTGFLLAKEKFFAKKEEHDFHPHVSIATRDLHKKAFYETWENFKDKKYKAEWNVNDISVLHHNKKNWDVVHTSQFKN